MGRERSKRRSMKIRQARNRKAKLKKLRLQYLEGKKDKEKILEKVTRISPSLTKEEFIGKINKIDKSKSV